MVLKQRKIGSGIPTQTPQTHKKNWGVRKKLSDPFLVTASN